ncbi:MAG: IS607 family transposase [Candidatus Altiarchaeales archaeon]|nr:IS607 family transposase [Candidatus Altiarchaeales archaeon]
MSSKSTMTEHITLSAASKLLGVTVRSLRKWSDEGKLKTIRTEGGHRRVAVAEIHRLQGVEQKERTVTLAYCRCSTHKQEENLERQVGRVLEHCTKQGWQTELFKEIGSGLNDNRAQFKRLLTRVVDDDVARVAVEFKDRLARFGFETFVIYCRNFGVDVVVLEDVAPKEFEQEFADDIISLVASYSGRMYGRRGGRKKKVKTDE